MITYQRHLPSPQLHQRLAPVTKASLLADTAFLDLFNHLSGQPVWWLATEDDDILAAIAGIEFGQRWLRRFQSLPDGLYSRLCLHRDARNRADQLAHDLLDSIAAAGYIKSCIYDYHFELPATPRWRHQNLHTQLVEIPSSDWMPPNRQLRSEINKAEREGLAVQAFDPARHMDGFMTLVSTTARRNRTTPRYPRRFFEALAALSQQDNRILWRWCEHDTTPIASHIYLIEPPMALAWQIFFDKQFAPLKANQFILHRTALMLFERDITVLNLGGSPANVQSVAGFKQKWGAEPYRYPMYSRRTGLGRLL
jgi:hypothetical protein